MVEMTEKPKNTILRNLVKSVIPKKLGKPKEVAKIKAERGSRTTADMLKSIKNAKSKFGKKAGNFKV